MATYTVKAGDTLERIAERELGDKSLARKIAQINNLANAGQIHIGQQLMLPGEEDTGVVVAEPAPAAPASPAAPVVQTPVAAPVSTGVQNPATPAPSTPAPTVVGNEVLVKVPYHSQEDADAKWAAADCGPTCIRMLMGWDAERRGLPMPNVTVDDVSKATGMGRQSFSQFKQLVSAGEKFGLKLNYQKDATLDRIKQQIQAGKPVLALVLYRHLTKRQNQKFGGGHFLVVVGYTDQEVILNDPDWWGDKRSYGNGFRVPTAEFEKAIGPNPFNPPYQALFIE